MVFLKDSSVVSPEGTAVFIPWSFGTFLDNSGVEFTTESPALFIHTIINHLIYDDRKY